MRVVNLAGFVMYSQSCSQHTQRPTLSTSFRQIYTPNSVLARTIVSQSFFALLRMTFKPSSELGHLAIENERFRLACIHTETRRVKHFNEKNSRSEDFHRYPGYITHEFSSATVRRRFLAASELPKFRLWSFIWLLRVRS